mgnify:CR=1 FL=1
MFVFSSIYPGARHMAPRATTAAPRARSGSVIRIRESAEDGFSPPKTNLTCKQNKVAASSGVRSRIDREVSILVALDAYE